MRHDASQLVRSVLIMLSLSVLTQSRSCLAVESQLTPRHNGHFILGDDLRRDCVNSAVPTT